MPHKNTCFSVNGGSVVIMCIDEYEEPVSQTRNAQFIYTHEHKFDAVSPILLKYVQVAMSNKLKCYKKTIKKKKLSVICICMCF